MQSDSQLSSESSARDSLGQQPSKKIPSDASGIVTSYSITRGRLEASVFRTAYMLCKSTQRHNILANLASWIIILQMIGVVAPKRGFLDSVTRALYSLCLPIYDDEATVTWLAVSLACSAVVSLVLVVVVQQLKVADNGKINPVVIGRLAIIIHLLVSAGLAPFLLMMTPGLYCVLGECTGTVSIVNSVIACILCPLVVVLGAANTFFVSPRNPSSRSYNSAVNTVLQTCYYCLNVMLIVTVPLTDADSNVQRNVFIFTCLSSCYIVLFFKIVARLPYYNKRANLMTSGACLAIGAANVCRLLSEVYDVLYLIVVFLSAVTLAFMIGYSVAAIRYKSVIVKPARRTFEKADDDVSSSVIYKNILDVELRTRYLKFVHKKSFALAVPYCAAEYNAALEQFPDSALLRALRGLFYFGYTNDALMSRVEIQKGLKLETSIDERYLMFCLDFEYAEQRVSDAHGGQLDLITFPEFAKNFRLAQKMHRTAVRVIHAFWKTLLAEKPDLNILPALIAKMQRIESTADGLFLKLLTQGSKSQAVLREYGQYLRNVKLNPDEASRFEARAEAIEKGEYDPKGVHGNSSSGMSTSDVKNNLDESDLSTQGKIKKSMRRGASTAGNDVSLAALRTYAVIAFCCILLLMTGVLVDGVVAIDDISRSVGQAEAAGERLELVAYSALLSREIRAIGLNPLLVNAGIPGMTDSELHSNLLQHTVRLHDVHMALVLGTSTVSKVNDDFNNQLASVPNVLVEYFSPGVLTLPWAMNHYISSLDVVARCNTTLLTEAINGTAPGGAGALRLSNKFKYVVENGHSSILDACSDSVNGIVGNQQARLETYEILAAAVVLGSVVFLMVIGLLIFKQALQDIQFDRNVALNLFLYIPKDTIMRMISDNRKTLNERNYRGDRRRNNKNRVTINNETTAVPAVPEVVEELEDATDKNQSSDERPSCASGDSAVDDTKSVDDAVFVSADKTVDSVKYLASPRVSKNRMVRSSSDEISIVVSDASTKLKRSHSEVHVDDLKDKSILSISPESVSRLSASSRAVVVLCLVTLIALTVWSFYGSTSISTMASNLSVQLEKINEISQYLKDTRELVIRAQYFSLSGDFTHVEAYFAVLNEDRRRQVISNLRAQGMTQAEMELFVAAKVINDRLCDVAGPSMALAASAFGVLHASPILEGLDWNEQARDDYEIERLLYPKQTAWLTNKTHDMSLNNDAKLKLARNVVLGYWHSSKTADMDIKVNAMADSIENGINDYIVQAHSTSDLLTIVNIVLGVILFILSIIVTALLAKRRSVIYKYYVEQEERNSVASGKSDNYNVIRSLSRQKSMTVIVCLLLVACSIMCIGLQVTVIETSYTNIEATFIDLKNEKSSLGRNYVLSMGTVRRVQSFADSCDLYFYDKYYKEENGPHLLINFETSYSQYMAPAAFNAHMITMRRLIRMENISMAISAHRCNKSAERTSEVFNINWNYTAEDDYDLENVNYVNRSLHYTDRASDLALNETVLGEIARLTVSDSRYWATKITSRLQYAVITQQLDDYFVTRFNDASNSAQSFSLNFSFVLAGVWLSCFAFLASIITSLTKAEAPFSLKRLDLALVKQNVKLQEMKQLTDRFLFGYMGSVVLIVVYMIVAVIVLSGHRYDVENVYLSAKLSSHAALLPFYAAGSVASFDVQELYRQSLSRAYEQLRISHLNLVKRMPAVMDFKGDSIGSDSVIENLGYTAYALLGLGRITDTHEYFIDLFKAYHDARDHLIGITDHVVHGVVESLATSDSFILVMFVCLFTVFVLLIYFTAIRSLRQIMIENERTSIMLMMIPQEVLITVPEIRGYMQRHSEQKDRFIELEENQLEQMRKDMQKLQEQNRIQNKLVNSMLPPHIAKQLAKGKTVKPERYEAVTVLFSDIVGFTTLCGQLDPIRVMAMLNKLFMRFDALTKEHGLFKVETIGDAYMVVGGIPKQVPDHAQRCASMALDMIASVADFQMTLDDGTNLPLRVRVGLNSGSVVASVVGDIRCNPRYCLFGDTVNTASRMESTGVPMRVQMTQATADLIKNDFTMEERGQVEVKGKGMMQTWFLLNRTTSLSFSKLPVVRELEQSLPNQTCVKQN